MRFVDETALHVKAGDGGDGCSSFRREKFVPRGGPDGGDGGDGGDVLVSTDPNLNSLAHLTAKSEVRAGDGERGKSKKRDGANGQDAVIRVPVGTIVSDEETGLTLLDLAEPREPVVIAEGGRGGRGNNHFKSPTNQAPTRYEEGKPGRERDIRLELKLVAQVGLIGRPNAGKSTLLSHISAAHPKVADYPFTTLQPMVGIVETRSYERFAVADLPGLIRGAHEGKGLGDEFLRHIERTRLLVHLVDAAPADGSDPLENYHAIRDELRLHSEELAAKPEIVVANKMDLEGAEEGLRRLQQGLDRRVLPISAVTGEGLERLIGEMLEALREQPSEASQAAERGG
jgi:GTP-binding protein